MDEKANTFLSITGSFEESAERDGLAVECAWREHVKWLTVFCFQPLQHCKQFELNDLIGTIRRQIIRQGCQVQKIKKAESSIMKKAK